MKKHFKIFGLLSIGITFLISMGVFTFTSAQSAGEGMCLYRQSCVIEADCADGFECISNICKRQKCTSDDDCSESSNLFCYMASGEEAGECRVNYACDTDSDCPNSSYVCDEEHCVYGIQDPEQQFCATSDDPDFGLVPCPTGYFCDVNLFPKGDTQGRCRYQLACEEDSQCPVYHRCNFNNVCEKEPCEVHGDCAPNHICVIDELRDDGECVPDTSCTEPFDCPESYMCQIPEGKDAGYCNYDLDCTTLEDCPDGYTCNNSVCSRMPCSGNTDCPEYQMCQAGSCYPIWTCDIDSDCIPSYVCRSDGICVYSLGANGQYCLDDQEDPEFTPCPSGYKCDLSGPGPSEGVCQYFDGDATGDYCDESYPCPDSFLCVESACYSENPPPGSQYCSNDPENLIPCIGGYTCVDNTCRVSADNPNYTYCDSQLDCESNYYCDFDHHLCNFQAPGSSCGNDQICPQGQVCAAEICKPTAGSGFGGECIYSQDCPMGEYCNSVGNCIPATDLDCDGNEDCRIPMTCSEYGFCRNPSSGSQSFCEDNTDCASGYVCNEEKSLCEYQGFGGSGTMATADTSFPASAEHLSAIDSALNDLMTDLRNIANEIASLPDELQDKLRQILSSGTLSEKIAGVEDLIDDLDNPAHLRVLEKILHALNGLLDLRTEMDLLREVMPESKESVKLWNEASDGLNKLVDDPLNDIRLRRFEKSYRALRKEIDAFPVVQARIRAVPASGSAPLLVTLDGFESIDPTGGTISEYKWSYLDNNSNLVSLGDEPILVHEFKEPNTYAIRLQASTSQKDDEGYNTAADGIAIVRVKVTQPASRVAFRVNGTEVQDVHHVTLSEGRAGLAFDPSSTVPAVGRIIEEYEWLYGDTMNEKRSVPSTVIHSYSKTGEYMTTLKVTDNHGTVDKSIIKLYVKSLAAQIDIKPKEGNVNTEFSVTGINSRSDEGTIEKYEWKIEDADGNKIHESTESSFSHRFGRPGEYKVILLVTDSTGAQDKNLKILKVLSRTPNPGFSYEVPEGNHPNTVHFNAIDSYDPDTGDSITYSWDFDGDGNYDELGLTNAEVNHEYRKAGDYRAVLEVRDAFGKRAQTEKKVSVDSTLSGDIIIESRAAHVGEEVTLKAESEKSEAYLWEFGDGETLSTEELNASYTYKEKGTYNVIMHFFDRDDNENTDTVKLLVGDQDSPVAVADILINGREKKIIDDLCGKDESGIIVTRADNIMLSAKQSINRDGSARMLTYDWKFSDGTRSSRKEFSHRFDEVNTSNECFGIELKVRDQISGKVSLEDIANFKVMNEEPKITDFIITPTEPGTEIATPAKIKLRVVRPKDNDGQIKKYRWWYYLEGKEEDKKGVHSTSLAETEMIITAEGQPDIMNRYFFVVEVSDNDSGVFNSKERFGEISSLDIKNGPNLSPVADFTVDKTTIATGDSITFVSKSYDPQGDILPNDSYYWDFDGDGEFDDTSSGSQLNRQFNTPGEYKVRLKVIYRGLSSSATKTIFVEAVNSLPQAAYTYDIDGNTVTFDGSNSRFDPDVQIDTLRFEWDFDIKEDSNGNGINDDDVEATEIVARHTYDKTGIYRAKLVVKDASGLEGIVVRDIDLATSQEERNKNTTRSLVITSTNQALTTLSISATPTILDKGQTADIEVSLQNADNSPYYGQVFFDILEGSGEFTPNPVDAKDSKAIAIFSAVDSGLVRIRVRAISTYYGELSEEIVLNVK